MTIPDDGRLVDLARRLFPPRRVVDLDQPPAPRTDNHVPREGQGERPKSPDHATRVFVGEVFGMDPNTVNLDTDPHPDNQPRRTAEHFHP